MFEDPLQVWKEVRAQGGVAYRDEIHAWVVVDYAMVQSGLRDARLSNQVAGSGPASGPLSPLIEVLRDQLFLMDPPRHRHLRKLVAKAFTPRSIAALESDARQDCEQLLNFTEGDFVAKFAYPYPVHVIARLFGIPAHEHSAFQDWSNAIAAFVVQYKPPREVVANALRAVAEIKPYLRERIRDRQQGGDDLLARLLDAREQGEALTEDELIHTAMQFLIAGHETTTNLLGNIVLALTHHRPLLSQVRETPTVAKAIIEETLRYDPSVQMVDRIALEPLTIGEANIAPGDRVMLSVAGANRDPAIFEQPDQFDITRKNVSKHLGFGSGIHVCLGAALTRLETCIAVETLAQHAERIEITAPLTYRPSTTHRGLVALPVKFD